MVGFGSFRNRFSLKLYYSTERELHFFAVEASVPIQYEDITRVFLLFFTKEGSKYCNL